MDDDKINEFFKREERTHEDKLNYEEFAKGFQSFFKDTLIKSLQIQDDFLDF